MAEIGGQEVGPVVLAIRTDAGPYSDRFPDDEGGMFQIGLCGLGDGIDIVDPIKAGSAVGRVPVQANDFSTVGDHLVGVAVEGGMHNDVTRGSADTAEVTGFVVLSFERDCYVGAKVSVTREREFFGEGFEARDRLAELDRAGQRFYGVKWIQDEVD